MGYQHEIDSQKIQGGFAIKTILEKAIVEFESVGAAYNGEYILKDITMAIRHHDFVGVIGPNGGGKSTLLKLILGIVKPVKGEVRVMGKEPGHFNWAIGYVPQNVNINENFPITVLDVALMGAIHSEKKGKSNKKQDRDKAMDILNSLQLEKHAFKKIGELSGGQRQRAFIARSLMTQPQLLLLDEPTASIDTRGQTDFYQLLEQLNKKIAIVLVSHDLFTISNYVKSVACVNQGLHYHSQEELTGNMLETMYACSVEDVCRVQVMTHGLQKNVSVPPKGETHGNP